MRNKMPHTGAPRAAVEHEPHSLSGYLCGSGCGCPGGNPASSPHPTHPRYNVYIYIYISTFLSRQSQLASNLHFLARSFAVLHSFPLNFTLPLSPCFSLKIVIYGFRSANNFIKLESTEAVVLYGKGTGKESTLNIYIIYINCFVIITRLQVEKKTNIYT